jgi:hypothetical protein
MELLEAFQRQRFGSKHIPAAWLAEQITLPFSTESKIFVQQLIENSSVVIDSVLHPNGFLKLTLARLATGYALRMHIWLDSQRDSIGRGWGNIHNHRWAFNSIVLTGSYENEIYSITDDGIACYSYTYASNVKIPTLIRQSKMVYVTLRRTQTLNQGSMLSLAQRLEW